MGRRAGLLGRRLTFGTPAFIPREPGISGDNAERMS